MLTHRYVVSGVFGNWAKRRPSQNPVYSFTTDGFFGPDGIPHSHRQHRHEHFMGGLGF